MAYSSNISAFLPNSQTTDLFDAYRILVAVELLLKDAGMNAGTSGHDIPAMLNQLINKNPHTAAQIYAHIAKLKFDLQNLTCNDKKNQPAAVKADNYPHARYTRMCGDWNGIRETPAQAIKCLSVTCHSLLAHLKAHRKDLGLTI